jgi:predicted SnoaL-like aldol condensation-catalyzing enzyme
MAIGTSGLSVPSVGQGIDTSIYGNKEIPKGMSLNDIVNLSRTSTALQKEKALLQPEIEAGQAASRTAIANADTAQLGLANTQRQISSAALTGLENSEAYKSNDAKAIKKELEATEKWLKTVSPNILKEGGVMDQAHQIIDKGNVEEYKQHLANIRRQNTSGAEQYAAALPQFNTNAAGTPFLTNRAAGTVSVPQTQGGQNATPTNVGVANFGDYQKDLTTRVASATQNEMRLNEAENLMKEFKPGAGSRTYVDIAQKLQAVGAPQSLVDSVAKGDLSAAQSLNKFIAQTVIQAATATPGTAESINRYIRDNPDIGSDPRSLERFFEFTRKQNAIPIEEQQFLLEKAKKGNLNPDTHVAEAQQHILEKFAQKQNTITGKERGNATYGKYKGHDVVSHDGGKTWEYK